MARTGQMLAVLNTMVLSLMDLHQVPNVTRQLRRFASYPDEPSPGSSAFEKPDSVDGTTGCTRRCRRDILTRKRLRLIPPLQEGHGHGQWETYRRPDKWG